jgi:heterodisulfide reductase subunit A
MVTVGQRKNIHLLSFSEVEEVSGVIGSFRVKVRRKARYIDEDKCTGCGLCYVSCPSLRIPKRRVIKLGDQVVKELK